jgi:hypothetical protein
LTGEERSAELELLGKDIFSYYGLGCRNVSKLYLPMGFNLELFGRAFKPFSNIIQHSKYANNYDYQKSIFLINAIEHNDMGFVLFKKDKSIPSPISVVNYEEYRSIDEVREDILLNNDGIQCVVSSSTELEGVIPFGKSQQPALWEYADDVDVMEFLLAL